ncbi:hypothetical protein ETU10_07235 [Apibacter muscae]|uniref:hypothetical protein n=1 Tax=Apibacter muscae TaxID=2509004 RepID=UPI0011ABBF0D|nr:hypothetical protein [Apibacter muscae]TWP23509.1 hypothetical protein ETU10_07235 [Apibacter muscae]
MKTRKKYMLSSLKFQGFAFFEYEEGVLLSTSFSEDFSLTAQERALFIKENYCVLEKNLSKIIQKIGLTLTEVPPAIDFNSFWNTYNYKVGSKIKAQEAWAKLKEEEKIKAIQYIPANEEFKKASGQAKLYPERYIKYKVWEK